MNSNANAIFAPLAMMSTPDQSDLNSKSQSALMMVQSMVIDSQDTFELAADELKAIKKKSKDLEEQRTSITGPIKTALKAVNNLFRAPSDFLEQAEKVIKVKMLAYQTEQERIAAEERRRAEEAIRQEQARLARESAEKEAEAKKEADRLLSEGNAEKAAEVQANAAIEMANLTATAQVMTAPVAAPSVAKVSGISTRGVWKAELTDKAALVAFIAQNPQFLNLVDVNTSGINQMAKAMKETMNIPGIRAFEERALASRAA